MCSLTLCVSKTARQRAIAGERERETNLKTMLGVECEQQDRRVLPAAQKKFHHWTRFVASCHLEWINSVLATIHSNDFPLRSFWYNAPVWRLSEKIGSYVGRMVQRKLFWRQYVLRYHCDCTHFRSYRREKNKTNHEFHFVRGAVINVRFVTEHILRGHELIESHFLNGKINRFSRRSRHQWLAAINKMPIIPILGKTKLNCQPNY